MLATREKIAAGKLGQASKLIEAQAYEKALKALDALAREFPKTQAGAEAVKKAKQIRSDSGIMDALTRKKNLKKCRSWFQLAENLRKNGMTEKALALYRKVAKLLPDTDLGKKAANRIRELE